MTTLQLPQILSDQAFADQPQPLVAEWAPGLLGSLREYAATNYHSKTAHGADLGGILLGERDGNILKIQSWQPIHRGDDATAHFYLTPADERALSHQLSRLPKSQQVLGWFRSRQSGFPRAEQHDKELHLKFFPDAPLFGIIRPSHQRPSDFHLFELGPSEDYSLLQKLQLAPSAIPGVSLTAAPAAAPRRFSWTKLLATFSVLSLILFTSLLVLQWNEQSHRPQPQEALNLQLQLEGSDLKATWNASSTPVKSSDFAQISFGGEKLQLSHSELIQGSLRLPMSALNTEEIEISLKVGNREEVARLILPIR